MLFILNKKLHSVPFIASPCEMLNVQKEVVVICLCQQLVSTHFSNYHDHPVEWMVWYS